MRTEKNLRGADSVFGAAPAGGGSTRPDCGNAPTMGEAPWPGGNDRGGC